MASVTKRVWTAAGREREAWQVRYTDQGGRARCKQFPGKRAAAAFAKKVETEKMADDGPRTLVDLCNDYLRLAQLRRAEGRIGGQRLQAITSAISTKVQPHFGPKLADAVTVADIEDYHSALLGGGTLNGRSARVQLEYLLLVEEQANKRGYMLTRPVAAAMRDLRVIPRNPIRTFTVEEIRTIVAEAAGRPRGCHEATAARLACFVNVAAFCGLRRGEIAALRLDSVRFAERVIEVRQSLTDRGELKRPKTKAGRRDVPMPPHVADMLRAWIDRHQVSNQNDLLFTGRGGGVMNPNSINEVWPGLLERCGLAHKTRPFHFHALRHFYASMMIEAGTPLADAAILLGHSSFDETLQTYAHSVIRSPQRHAFVDRMVDRFALPGSEGHALPPATLAIAAHSLSPGEAI